MAAPHMMPLQVGTPEESVAKFFDTARNYRY